MMLKSWMLRMAITYPDLAFMVFDSIKESEYGKGADGSQQRSFLGLTDAKLIRFSPGEPMGLNPLLLFCRKQVASILTRMAHISAEESNLKKSLRPANVVHDLAWVLLCPSSA